MKLSEIYGMSARRADGGARGYVIKIYADGEKITGAQCADERENEFFISAENTKVSGNKLIFSRAEKCKPDGVPVALGRACYNVFGEYIGVLKDIGCRGLKLVSAKIGAKNHAAKNLIFGDVIIVKPSPSALKDNVVKNGKVVFKSGEEADKKLIDRAISLGEYVQTNLKKI